MDNMKSYRFYGDEMEVLGRRLDAARQALSNSTTMWSICHWTQVVDQLLFQWRQLPILHDGDAHMTLIPRWTIDYEFYETGRPHEYAGITERAYDKLFRESANLDESWHNHRAQRLAKAQ
jgi:hypothetical protein